MTRPRLAFVVPYGYPALRAMPRASGFDYVGGAEMQQARLLAHARRPLDTTCGW
jgi:hypothetical protein